MLDPQSIFDALQSPPKGESPAALLEAAVAQREALTPLLLDELRQQVETRFAQCEAAGEVYWRHHFAIYLLAYFGEAAAYPLFVEMALLPGEVLDEATGDMVTEDLPELLLAVAQGRAEGIWRIIESDQPSEYVRSAALYALERLFADGHLERGELVAFLERLMRERLPHEECENGWVWEAAVDVAVNIRAQGLLPDILSAYGDRFPEEYATNSPERAKQMIQSDFEPSTYLPLRKPEPLDEPGKFFSRFPYFRRKTTSETMFDNILNPSKTPAVRYAAPRTTPKIGRNEPCPCGSGKKYKKCCGNGATGG